MRRGFKAYAEKLSANTRLRLRVQMNQKINPRTLVKEEGCLVWYPQEIPNFDQCHIDQLLINDPESWDAMTIKDSGWTVIVINPSRPSTRQVNTIMHEWAHLKLKHKPSRVDELDGGLLLLSDYPKELEDEADWLAGAMLAPREGLMTLRRSGHSNAQVANVFGISTDLATWRLRMTGVDRQLSAGHHFAP